ncbi:hypothetical protein DFH08DRAFT_973256 [Mycena albidolilacea]|uniref:Uncharacterized protein n=1 Tax=Mycena albidolilacea TaxID=1033008 RepID=A0AAD7ED39_9AGAR|nr:hypothetical protein DFH08DRAFT_973256 [Mycena albidolilacea]
MLKDSKKPRKHTVVVRAPVAVDDGHGGTTTVLQKLKPKARATLEDATQHEMINFIARLSKEKKAAFDRLCDVPQDPAQSTLTMKALVPSRMVTSQKDAFKLILVMEVSNEGNDRRYIKWGATQGEFGLDGNPTAPAVEAVEGFWKVEVNDVFSTYTVEVPMTGDDVSISSCLVGQGIIPCAPWKPKLGVSTHVLELYRVARLQSPTLTIQPWVKTLSKLHGVAFKPYASQRLSKCFDVYLEILKTVDDCVMKVLGRDAPDWRLKNCCPACTYNLEGKMKLIFEMLMTMDGNNSLKRVLAKHGNSEHTDPRTAEAGGTYFLKREKVDRWSKEVLDALRGKDQEEESECQERWKNMSEEITARMWGIDETGVFLALCQHGIVLLVADMVRSGELAKYGLAITDSVLDAFGPDLGRAYDIGCGFGTTVSDSPLGERAKELNFKTLVGAFHGHAHNQLCQLRHLVTYITGLGLEDLEGCEQFFSKSNGLPVSSDMPTYANLSSFLVNNYKQALDILDLQDSLEFAMAQAGIDGPEVFEERLKQEPEYLKKLTKEPKEETDQMEYYQRLVNLAEQRENHDRAVTAVQEMERKMGIVVRWMVDDESYDKAAELVATRRYRKAVNKLEELVVKRIFELTKMNMSGTGYKLRKHIAKPLQARSKTIRAALNRYNQAAAALNPPRQQLTWEQVIDFSFLSDFDLLRDPEGNATLQEWATPAARELMDTHFKIQRAHEEIQRLNIEIRGLTGVFILDATGTV